VGQVRWCRQRKGGRGPSKGDKREAAVGQVKATKERRPWARWWRERRSGRGPGGGDEGEAAVGQVVAIFDGKKPKRRREPRQQALVDGV